MPLDSDLDAPLYGAGPIAEALNLRKDDGTPDVRRPTTRWSVAMSTPTNSGGFGPRRSAACLAII
jgi:hypothetical protein